jgi:SAM-dependent methyltransferase
MDERTAQQLIELNRAFYAAFAEPFAETRTEPQPGFVRLATTLSSGVIDLLDVGCGDGRFGRFLREAGHPIRYTGVDLTPGLLDRARSADDDVLLMRDLSRPGSLDGLGQFGCIACLSTLQHIPGHQRRLQLLRDMAAHLAPDGVLFLGNWQFLDSPRQRRKLRDWSLAGIDPRDVGREDHLLSWQRGGEGLRYVAHLDAQLTQRLISEAGLRLLDSFRSDGREGDLNLYSIVGS